MEKFTKLGLSKELTDVLKQFGFTEPSEIQEKAIPLALAGKDIIGGSATGSGKTLAFAAPIIENLKPNGNVQAIVLTPTRELAEQVATSIRNFGKNKKLNILAIYGGVNINSQMKRLSETDVVVGTPGRIIDHLNRRTLRLNNIKILILDEVDRMFDMGFSRDVERIIHECPTKRQTMMFSATVSQDIDYLAKKYTTNPAEISVNSYVDPSKLKQVYYDVPDNKKFSLLVGLLKKENADLVMVFCSTRRNVDFIARNLIEAGIHAKAIHGGIEQKKRIRVLEEFHKRGLGVLICTDIAARGLDIKGVSHVYNYDIPAEAKDYIHRIGRTARAGEKGKAITILASRDYEKFGNVMRSEEINITPEKLPQLEIIRIKMSSGRGDKFSGDFKRNNSSRGFSRRNDSQGSRRNFSRAPRRDFSKGQSNERSFGPRRFSENNSRRPNNKGPRNSYNRRDTRNSNNRDDSRRDNRPRDSNRSSNNGRQNSKRPFNKRRRF